MTRYDFITEVIVFKYTLNADIENCLALCKGNEAEIVTEITYNSSGEGKLTVRVSRASFQRLQVNCVHNDLTQLWLNDEVNIEMLYTSRLKFTCFNISNTIIKKHMSLLFCR